MKALPYIIAALLLVYAPAAAADGIDGEGSKQNPLPQQGVTMDCGKYKGGRNVTGSGGYMPDATPGCNNPPAANTTATPPVNPTDDTVRDSSGKDPAGGGK